MALELYNQDKHKCVVFENLVTGLGIQANQFLIADGNEGMLLDPGGNLTYKHLLAEMADFFPPQRIKYVFASHQDPDIVASVQGWLLITDARVLIPKTWERFIPHFCTSSPEPGRIIGVPDSGGIVTLGSADLFLLPAHFLHSAGNLQIYDPVSKILFSGDMGASVVADRLAGAPVTNFDTHVANMEGFHRRYMSSNKATKEWARMVRTLDVEWMVPQHGPSFKGKVMVSRFLDWIEQLECGVDIIESSTYRVPSEHVNVN